MVVKKQPTPVDSYVGAQLKLKRNSLGISQEKLAKQLNISFQQVQKYEKGTNRIGSSRLYEISKILNVTIGYFFEGCDEICNDQNNRFPQPNIIDTKMIKAFSKLNNTQQKAILNLILAMK